jgi:hypothetical protein
LVKVFSKVFHYLLCVFTVFVDVPNIIFKLTAKFPLFPNTKETKQERILSVFAVILFGPTSATPAGEHPPALQREERVREKEKGDPIVLYQL